MKGKMLFEVNGLKAGYNKKMVLNGISLQVGKGEIVALIGPNGAGKSTALKAIFGLLKVEKGEVIFKGCKIQNRKPTLNIKDGLSYVPQGSRVFTELSVLENLEMGGYTLSNKTDLKKQIEKVLNLFPVLRERRTQNAGKLSGGEKQMLAMGRAFMLNPELLLLDEPSLGLSPKLANKALNTIKDINSQLKTSILIVEQNVREVLEIADRVYILKLGQVCLHDTPQNLIRDNKIKEVYLS